jgi:hypothetical protein
LSTHYDELGSSSGQKSKRQKISSSASKKTPVEEEKHSKDVGTETTPMKESEGTSDIKPFSL